MGLLDQINKVTGYHVQGYKPMNEQMGLLSMGLPSPYGDVAGLLSDVAGYAENPESLTPGRGLLSLAALAPGIPRTPKKLYRGVGATGKGRGVATLGKGTYSTPSKDFVREFVTDPKTGKRTGQILELDPSEAMPKNPLYIDARGRGSPQALFNEWLLEQSGERNIRDFAAKWPDPADFVKSKGYDGVWAGDEIVKY